MKRLLFALCALAFVAGCNSSNEDTVWSQNEVLQRM